MQKFTTKNIRKKSISLVALFSLAFLPSLAFAQTDSGNKGQKNKDNRARTSVLMGTSTVACPTSAFGHLIAPGKIKRLENGDNMHHDGMVMVPEGCVLPPGIAKKVHMMMTGTSTDTTGPNLSGITFLPPSATSATFNWNTNEAADSAVFYSTALPVDVNAAGTQVVSSGSMMTSHSVTLTGLTEGTTYYVLIRSRDAAGNTTFSTPLSFTAGNPIE